MIASGGARDTQGPHQWTTYSSRAIGERQRDSETERQGQTDRDTINGLHTAAERYTGRQTETSEIDRARDTTGRDLVNREQTAAGQTQQRERFRRYF